MFSWRSRRQLVTVIILLSIVGVPAGLVWYLNAPFPSCFDGIQNQGERGVDCGGSCARVCEDEVAAHTILWAREFEAQSGSHYLAALVDNPNRRFGAEKLTYTFEVYDATNNLVLEKTGKSFSNPREHFIIFEPNIMLKGDGPFRVFLEITDVTWKRYANYTQPELRISNESLSLSPSPKLTATLYNESLVDYEAIEAAATVYNEEDNVIAVSKTRVRNVGRDSPKSIFFSWPRKFPEAPRICIDPVQAMLVFDRSGSMNDDNVSPPQPLTAAKGAAQTFVNQLSQRDEAGLVSFATTASDPADHALSGNLSSVVSAIENISILPSEEHGFTNLGDGIAKASDILTAASATDKTRKVMVILTDGVANAPRDPGGEVYAREKAKTAHALGYEVYVIGLGDAVNQTFLRNDIASSPQHYYFSSTKEELAGIYREIAESVCPDRVYLTNVFIRPAPADL